MTNCKCHNHKIKSDNESNNYSDNLQHTAEAIILSCIDYRFIDNMISFLEASPIAFKYDITALAGASLAFNQKKYKYWTKTIIDQIKLAIELHHINQIIVFDHMDCGAYQLFYPNLKPNSDEERKLHIKNIKKFIHKMKDLFPEMVYKGYLINFDGKSEQLY